MNRIKVIVVTLEEFPARLQALAPEIDVLRAAGFSVEIFAGVNGREIIVSDTDDPHLKRLNYRDWNPLQYNRRVRLNGNPMTPGEFGCAWSHYRIYEKLVADTTADIYLVLEDDAERQCPIEQILESLRQRPPYFDVIRTTASLYYPFAKHMDFNSHFYTYQKRFSNYTTSYLVSKQGAQKLLDYAAGRLDIPADDLLSEMYLHTSATYYASSPAWYEDPRTQPSTITAMRDPAPVAR